MENRSDYEESNADAALMFDISFGLAEYEMLFF